MHGLGFTDWLWRENLMSIYCDPLRTVDFLISKTC